MTPSADRVAAASAAWTWWPDDARVVETDEYLLVRFPDWFHSPLELLRLRPRRPVAAVLDEVLARAAGLDADRIAVWVLLDPPDGLEPLLRERGGEVEECVDVLAVDLGAGAPSLDVPDDVTLRWADELDTLRAFGEVSAAVFGGTVPPPERLETVLRETRDDDGGSGQCLATLDGRAVGAGGLKIVDGVARLWGGAVLPDARGRGVYRAVLVERLRRAADHGATLGLVKGRVETSGPILRRAGFTAYGQERTYVLPL